ncbi:hypothetical protein BH20ACI2_BH20ACI2_10640 [soil metagenome]
MKTCCKVSEPKGSAYHSYILIVLSKYTTESVFVKKNLAPHLPTSGKNLSIQADRGLLVPAPFNSLVYSHPYRLPEKMPNRAYIPKTFIRPPIRTF